MAVPVLDRNMFFLVLLAAALPHVMDKARIMSVVHEEVVIVVALDRAFKEANRKQVLIEVTVKGHREQDSQLEMVVLAAFVSLAFDRS